MMIYKITNLINGKIYIGQTTKTIEERFEGHSHADTLIGKTIREYGKKNFKIEVIEKCSSKEELDAREYYWIKTLDSQIPNGYNITEDGQGIIPRKNSTQSRGEPEFVKLYVDGLNLLKDLPKSHTAVFYSLLRYMTYADDKNPQVIFANSFVKRQIIMENPEIMSTQTIMNAISNLKKKEILEEVGRATYRVNPRIIGKGDWRDIQNLKLNIFYDKMGRTVTADFNYSDEEKIIDIKGGKKKKSKNND